MASSRLGCEWMNFHTDVKLGSDALLLSMMRYSLALSSHLGLHKLFLICIDGKLFVFIDSHLLLLFNEILLAVDLDESFIDLEIVRELKPLKELFLLRHMLRHLDTSRG